MKDERLAATLETVLIDRLGLPGAALQVRLLRSWAEIAGPLLSGKTSPGRVRNGVLTVFVRNHAWAQELQLSQPALLEKIRAVVGEGKVREVRFAVASGPGHPGGLPGESPDVRPVAAPRDEEGDEPRDGTPPPEPPGLEAVRDPETREILRGISRKSSRRRE